MLRCLKRLHRFLLNDIEQGELRRFCVPIDKVHDLALLFADNPSMWIRSEVPNSRRMPVIAACHSACVIEPLLDDRPFPFGSDDESVQIDLEAIGDRVVVDSCCETTGSNERLPVETAAL